MIAYLKSNEQTARLADEIKTLDPGISVQKGDTLIHISTNLANNNHWNFYIGTYGYGSVLVVINRELNFRSELPIDCVDTIYQL